MPVGLNERVVSGRHARTNPATAPRSTTPPRRAGRRSTWWPVLVAAATAITTVTVAQQFEPSPTTSTEPVVDASADTSGVPRVTTRRTPATGVAPAGVPRSTAEPLGRATASLSVDGMALRLAAGTAALAVGDSPSIELTTTRIGDVVVDDTVPPAVDQRDGEISHVWPGVTEWYRALESGFEHGYTIARPVHGGDTLTIDVTVAGAEALDVDGDIMFVRDGERPVWYRGLHVFDADGATLPASMSAAGSAITIEVDTSGATYPVTVDPVIAEEQALRTGFAGDEFGSAVAVDGNRMAVGAPASLNVDGGGAGLNTTGAVLLYTRTGPGQPWTPDGVIVNPAPSYSEFGRSVALAGDRLAVGAPTFVLGPFPDRGRVFLYENNGVTWLPLPEIAPAGASSYGFGFAVDFATPDYLVIGAPGFLVAGEDELGPGQVFEYRSGVLSLIPTGGVTGNAWMGYSVAADVRPGGGFRVAVGAPNDDAGAGLFRVLDDPGTGVFSTVYGLTNAEMGTAVDVSGDRVAYATTNNVSIASTTNGGTSWTTELTTSVARGTYPGTSFNRHFDLEGGTLAVGAPVSNRAEIFRYDGFSWGGPVLSVGADTLVPGGAAGDDRVGFAVALDGPSLAVGAPGDDGPGDATPDGGAVFTVDVPVVSTYGNTGGSFLPWNVAGNWDTGDVPGPNDVAIVPDDAAVAVTDTRTVDRIVLGGQVDVNDGGRLDISGASEITSLGIAFVSGGGVLGLPDQLFLDGTLVTRDSDPTPGLVLADGPTLLAGDGLVANSGLVVKTGTEPFVVGPALNWNTGRNGSLVASDGLVDVRTTSFDGRGRLAVAAGARIDLAGDLILRPSSVIEVEILGTSIEPENYGAIDVAADLGFEPFAPGALPPDTTQVTLRADFGPGPFAPAPDDRYPILTCGNCRADPPGNPNGVEFDDFDVGALDAIQTANAITLGIVPNKLRDSVPGETGFGADVDVDGDWAVVARPTQGMTVLRRDPVLGWQVAQEIGGAYSKVAIDGDRLVGAEIGGTNVIDLYTRTAPGDPFLFAQEIEEVAGDVDIDGDLLIIGLPSTSPPTAVVYPIAGAALGSPTVLTTVTPIDTLGAVVAIVELSPDDAFAFVSAPSVGGPGAVYAYKRSGGGWDDLPVETYTSPDAGPPNREFGSALAVSADRLVVGQRLNSFVAGDQGAAFVYEGEPGTYGPPVRLIASDGESGDVFGSAVAMDGDTIVVGAGAAQKFTFPYRDGSAYVFAFNGSTWVETEQLRAPDGYDQERFGDAVAISGTDVLVGAPEDDNSNGPLAGAVYTFDVAEVAPGLTFDFGVAPGSGTVQLGTSVAVNELQPRTSTTRAATGSTLAAASVSSIRADDPQATALAQIAVGATPLSSIVLDSVPLSSIPLLLIDIDGGWARILAGSELENEPFASLTFGQVLAAGSATNADTPAGRFAATPLSSIDVDGTPLSSIPLSSIVLADIPLSSIDVDFDWCAVVAELIPPGTDCNVVLADLTLMEAGLRGVPLSSIPLSSIPLSSIDGLSSTPLSSIPLSSIQLERSPLSSIPLSSIDLAGTPLSSIPLSSIPLSSIPLSSIPLSSIDISGTPLSSIPLSSIPLSSIPTSIPLSSIDLRGAPLSSIPLSSIVLADTPLSSIPLSSIQVNPDGTVDSQAALAAWCAALDGSGYDCDSGVDATTTLRDLSVYGVPLSSIPLSSIPLSSIDLTNTPLSSIPLSSIPLSSIPLSSIPLSSIPLSSIDLNGVPLSSIPLSSIPLSSIDVGSTPLSSIPLSSIPLSSIPLSSIPLSSIVVGTTPLSSIPLSSIDVANTPLSSIPLSSIPLSSIDCSRVDCQRGTLGDAARAGAIGVGTTLGTIQEATAGLRFGTFLSALPPNLRDQIVQAIQSSQLTLTDLLGFDGLTLGDLPPALFAQLTLGDLGEALTVVTFADLLGAPIIDPTTGQPFTDVAGDLRVAIDGQGLTLGDLLFLGDLTLGDLLDGYTGQLTLLDIEPILGFISVAALEAALNITLDLGGATLGGLTAEQLGDLTISDLLTLIGDLEFGDLLATIDEQLANFTLGDLLLALVDPGSLALGGVEFADVAGSELPPGTVPPTSFESSFTLTGGRSRPVVVQVDAPPGTAYVAGSSLVEEIPLVGPALGEQLDPVVDGSSFRWAFVADPDTEYSIRFDAVTPPRIGTTSFDATARVGGTDLVIPVSAEVTVAEGAEPNDFPEVVDAFEDFVYLTYISTPTDNDVYAIDLAENDQLIVQLSNLAEDLDFAVWGRPTDQAGSGPLSGTSDEAPIDPVTDPDADATTAEPLDDFRRLDAIDSTLSLLGVANRSGTTTESFTSGRLPAGRYFVQVFGSNGATNARPAALQLAVIEGDDVPACSALGVTDPGIARGDAPTIGDDVNTLILLNESRLERFYDPAGRQQVLDALDELTTHLQGDPTIVPAVVPVDGYASVEAAYDAWDTDGTCDPESANAVVAAINADVIDPVREQLDHVVILGADEQIPMARLTDATEVANEYDFRYEFEGDLAGGAERNAFTSSFWNGTILSDEPYGDADARSLGDRFLYVTDLALGRVVESPADIADALTTFVQFDGQLAIDTAAVLGYDFLVDGSEEIATTLGGALPGAVDDDLADGIVPATGRPWDRVDATAKLAAAAQNALISLNAHFDHYRALPAIGDKVPGFLDNLIAEDVAAELGADALQRSLVFSMGCHSGLSVSDITIANTNADWAEVLGQQGALFVGNTGFGYGDTETVAYTELLMALFAEQVTAPLDLSGAGDSSTVGQALAWAKNEFVAGLQSFSVYDEKAVMESTFYGLPFYRVGIPGGDLADRPLPAPTAPPSGEREVPLTPTNDSNVTPSGTYFSNTGPDGEELVIVAPGRPIQPKISTDVSASDRVARGALIESMSSTWVDLPDPVIAQPIFDEAAGQPEPDPGDAVFPARPLRITTSTGPSGRRQQLVVATGQYRSDPGEQRLDGAFDITVYYGDPGGDVTPPTITNIRPVIDGDTLTVTADVTDDNTVDRVVVLVAERTVSDTAEWTKLELTSTGGSSWSGSRGLAPATIGVELLLQAKDAAGNVGVTTNKARNFADEVVFAEPEPTDPETVLDLTVSVTGTPGENGWFDGDVTVTPTGSNTISYSVDGADPVGIASGTPFTITGGGPHVWKVTTTAGEVRTGGVKIDDDGAPEIAITVPATNGDTFPSGTTERFDVRCTDLSLATCAARLNGSPIAPGSPLPTEPGDYTLVVRATDRVGNSTTASRSFEILPLVGPPEITRLDGPLTPVDQDAAVRIDAFFADVSGTADTYTATFDWGDGTVPVTVPVTAEPTAAVLGQAVGEHVYGAPGVYPVEVTIDDGAGGVDSATYSFVVVFDEDETGRVSGAGFFISGREAYPGTPWWGTPAYFGYHAQYEPGADRPTGTTLMKLIGRFFFQSTRYDYLTVNPSIAVAEGVGTMNGSTEYRFRVQGIDHGWLDFFQITIWDPATGDVVYDNGVLYDNGDLVLLGGIRIRQ